MDCRWRISQLGSILSSMKLWEWLGGEEEKKKETEREETRKVVWSGANEAWLQSRNGGSFFQRWTFPCLGHFLLVDLSHWGIFKAFPLSQISFMMSSVQSQIIPLTLNVQSSNPKLFTKWSFHKWNRNRSCLTAEHLLHWYSRRFNSWNIYWLESLVDCLKRLAVLTLVQQSKWQE